MYTFNQVLNTFSPLLSPLFLSLFYIPFCPLSLLFLSYRHLSNPLHFQTTFHPMTLQLFTYSAGIGEGVIYADMAIIYTASPPIINAVLLTQCCHVHILEGVGISTAWSCEPWKRMGQMCNMNKNKEWSFTLLCFWIIVSQVHCVQDLQEFAHGHNNFSAVG